jgi:ABC-2 type transport system ATP-binding protein
VLTKSGASVEICDIDSLVVSGMPAARIGDLALAARLAVHQLTPRQTSLEDAFLELTESIGSTS